jgi:uncharacterized protein YdaU (DUF1376 family)
MAKGLPWYKRDPERWIMGTRDLTLEERGAYSEIVDYLNLRGRPLPDDIRIIASLINTSPQKWRKIRQRLLDLGKIVIEGDYLTNPRFEREKAERELTRAEAQIHGREGGKRSAEKRLREPELDLDQQPLAHTRAHGTRTVERTARARVSADQPQNAKIDKTSQKSSKKVESFAQLPDEHLTPVSQKSANETQGYPQAPYARVRESEDKSIDSSQPDSLTTPRAHQPDLMAMYEAVCEASGFHTASPNAIDLALRTVEAWAKMGVDFEEVVLPTIRSVIASDHEPTRTLGRFTKAIAHQHARRKAQKSQGKTYSPPPSPILHRDDEEPAMADLRAVLCQVLGPKGFVLANLNQVRLRADDDTLRLDGWAGRLALEGNYGNTIKAVARRHGYDRVWT